MNTRSVLTRSTLLICAILAAQLHSFPQDSTNYTVSSPFPSLQLTNISATGNLSTGAVEIKMQFQNKSAKLADIYLSLGTFNDFGITDAKGAKYKVFTNEGLIESSPINQGFKRISSVSLGNSKLQKVTYLKDTLSGSSDIPFKVILDRVDKSTMLIKEMHVRCIFSPNHVWAGDQSYQIRNVKINWVKEN